MNAFRAIALAYAAAVLLIAPSQLVADDLVAEDPVPAAQVPLAAPAPEPAAEAPQEDAPVAVAQEPEEPTVAAKPVAKAAKKQEPQKEPIAHTAASGSVTISDFKFSPATITVNVGDTVTWTNSGPTPHSATANDGSFDTGVMDKGKSGSATFDTAGTIPYICTPHPFMKGTVVVQAASTDGPAPGDGTTSTDDDTAAADDSGGLPNTGGETLLIALLGLLTLGAGLVLRRREQAGR